jgi:hypothetical protein
MTGNQILNIMFWKNTAAIRQDVDGTSMYQQEVDIVDACICLSAQS